MAQLLAWEAQADFMESVRSDNTHIITKRPEILDAFRRRATNLEDREMLTFAAALLIVMGDPAGERLAKLSGK